MYSDFLYNEIESIMAMLQNETEVDSSIKDVIFDSLASLRLSIAMLDARDPLPLLADLKQLYIDRHNTWLGRTITRGDGI